MAFCYLDNEAEKEGFLLLDSLFVEHYLPYAGEVELKVYLYGLDLCRKVGENVSLGTFAEDLNLTESDVKDAFSYWEKQGTEQALARLTRIVRNIKPAKATLNPVEFLVHTDADVYIGTATTSCYYPMPIYDADIT